jgi:CDGSH iron-sulfur domain-containing protein 3
MASPNIAQTAPFQVKVEAGKSYWWCACGKSQKQPFCDGSHKGGEFKPVEFNASADGDVWFCGCKHSQKGALCDGTHKKLSTP